jgi:protein-S-isoprenylcysteine O-methyltransferase Ste14
MESKKDSPGVIIPPPLVYAAVFLISILLQRVLPMDNTFFQTTSSRMIGILISALAIIIVVPAVLQFFLTKNTVLTMKPANSLQTVNIYRFTRNPMYLGLLLLYIGCGFLAGNWWSFILLPELFGIVTYFIIMPEERYLSRTFGRQYEDYRMKVRRWF